ncbi:MAG: CYTH domain-containing protein [Bacilli bacterium]|nr:CYTH domain-containing protein [Bacilli bacterium]MDD4298850.1 CYTH domain-containing protein [Bacilli bacterium]
MKIEYEATILEIDKDSFEKQLQKMGAIKKGDYFQKRYTYNFNPIIENKWIRLRTNGEKTTLTIKKLANENIIGGTEELEIAVSDFEKTNKLLNELGYNSNHYQENKRTTYILNDIEIDIDTWPLIPTYAEIEGRSEKEVKQFIDKLGVDKTKITTLGVTSIYYEKYNIDIDKIEVLKFTE